jgi:hypothetical protein
VAGPAEHPAPPVLPGASSDTAVDELAAAIPPVVPLRVMAGPLPIGRRLRRAAQGDLVMLGRAALGPVTAVMTRPDGLSFAVGRGMCTQPAAGSASWSCLATEAAEVGVGVGGKMIEFGTMTMTRNELIAWADPCGSVVRRPAAGCARLVDLANASRTRLAEWVRVEGELGLRVIAEIEDEDADESASEGAGEGAGEDTNQAQAQDGPEAEGDS